MDRETFLAQLHDGLVSLGDSVAEDELSNLFSYFSELKKWRRRVNLIAKGAGDVEIVENHFIDSLTLLPLLRGQGVHLADIGTGAGFPGLVVKAVMPEIALTLVEPRQKRVAFLNHIVRTLGLERVTVHACRIEDEARIPSTLPVTHVTSRAVTEIGGFLEMTARFAQHGAKVICMKGPRWEEELREAEKLPVMARFHLDKVLHRTLPISGAKRSLLLFSTEKSPHSGS